MKTAILGTGIVGQTIAAKLISLGHEVMLGTRNVADTWTRPTPNNITNLTFAQWHDQNPSVKLGTFAEAAAFGDIVVNALNGGATIPAFKLCNAADLDNKIIIDIANPLDFSKGFPPFLTEGMNNTHSLGEELQNTLPNAKVVKTLNTMNTFIMVNPASVNHGNHTNFICGNDGEAKATIKSLLHDIGWKEEHILDLGDITNARGTEALLPIWVRIYGTLKSGAFNFAVVKYRKNNVIALRKFKLS